MNELIPESKNKILTRAVLYVIYSIGLLSFSAYILSKICFKNLFGLCDMPHINFLESAGFLSFAYILIFGIITYISNLRALSKSQMTNLPNTDITSEIIKNHLREMNQSEKDLLKKELANRCGIKEENNQHHKL